MSSLPEKVSTSRPAGANGAEQRLMASALSLFAERGYRGTSIREIIERAGVTRPVLYYYFENKEDLFCRLVQKAFEDFVAEVEVIAGQVAGCRQQLKQVMRLAFARAERRPEAVRLIVQTLFASPGDHIALDISEMTLRRFRVVADIMRAGLESGELSGGDAQTLALAFFGVMDMHLMARVHRPHAQLTDALADGLVDLFLEGAGGRKGPREVVTSPFLKPGAETIRGEI